MSFIQVKLEIGGKSMGQDWINTHFYEANSLADDLYAIEFIAHQFQAGIAPYYYLNLDASSSIAFIRTSLLNRVSGGRITYTLALPNFGASTLTLISPQTTFVWPRFGQTGTEPFGGMKRAIKSRLFLPDAAVESIIDGKPDLASAQITQWSVMLDTVGAGFANADVFQGRCRNVVMSRRLIQPDNTTYLSQSARYRISAFARVGTLRSREVGHGR